MNSCILIFRISSGLSGVLALKISSLNGTRLKMSKKRSHNSQRRLQLKLLETTDSSPRLEAMRCPAHMAYLGDKARCSFHAARGIPPVRMCESFRSRMTMAAGNRKTTVTSKPSRAAFTTRQTTMGVGIANLTFANGLG